MTTTLIRKSSRKMSTLIGILNSRLCPSLEKASGILITESRPMMIDASPLQTCCIARVVIIEGSPSLTIA